MLGEAIKKRIEIEQAISPMPAPIKSLLISLLVAF
jgi:hypothetical protein